VFACNELKTQIEAMAVGLWSDGTGDEIYYNIGSVGIGTTNPLTSFHVNGSTGGSNRVALFSSDDANPMLSVGQGTGGNDGLAIQYNQAGNYGSIAIHGDPQGTALVIADGGNVGMGTTSPTERLHIAEGSWLRLGSSGGVAAGLKLTQADSDIMHLYADGEDRANFRFAGGVTSELYFLNSAYGVIMALKENGRVGIGTTSPSTLLTLESSTAPGLTVSKSDTGITDNEVVGTLDFYGNDSSSTASGITGQIESRASARRHRINSLAYSGMHPSLKEVHG
jgi:hypothetical protein